MSEQPPVTTLDPLERALAEAVRGVLLRRQARRRRLRVVEGGKGKAA